MHWPQYLIDVGYICLVKATPRMQYLALSYVWGHDSSFRTLKNNLDSLYHVGSMARISSIPRTIQDVMKLTGLVGQQYLWVDSLCIVQDDEECKQEQLRHMGSIYANAYMTIVAANGTASDGLRGIEGITPPMQRWCNELSFTIDGPSLLQRLIEEHDRRIQCSDWYWRGWTFQEQIFSRRLIVFGGSEATWECHCAVWVEGLKPYHRQCQNSRQPVARGFDFNLQPNLENYHRHIWRYNRRELTYPEDALDAFSGILTILSNAFIGGFLAGLPIMFFDAALLWYNDTALARRHSRQLNTSSSMAPTWSWAAWKGDLAERSTLQVGSAQPTVEWVYKAGSSASLQGLPLPLSDDLISTAVNAKAIFEQLGDDHLPHLLYCRPLRSFFHVSLNINRHRLDLVGKAGRHVGMLVACEVLSQTRSFTCEVVVISSTIFHGEEVHYVLWIEWVADIAYRKGVGWVQKAAWDDQDDAEERIDLVLG
jgi:hypothetical protein